MQKRTAASWRIAWRDLELGSELARGNFGRVLCGEFRGGPCVVKELLLPEPEAETEAGSGDATSERAVSVQEEKLRLELLKEAECLASVRPHAAICQFFGVCAEPGHHCVVTEFVAGGSLIAFLRASAGVRRPLSWRDTVQLGRDLASGLRHIHSFNMLHLDVAARNTLIVADTPVARLKICDFGLMRSLAPPSDEPSDAQNDGTNDNNNEGDVSGALNRPVRTRISSRGQIFAPRWTAPEAWTDPGRYFCKKSEVWSWGVFMFEVVNDGDAPYRHLRENAAVREFVDGGGRLNISALDRGEYAAVPELTGLVRSCWSLDPAARPSFAQIVQRTREMLDSEDSGSAVKVDKGLQASLSEFGQSRQQHPLRHGQKKKGSSSNSSSGSENDVYEDYGEGGGEYNDGETSGGEYNDGDSGADLYDDRSGGDSHSGAGEDAGDGDGYDDGSSGTGDVDGDKADGEVIARRGSTSAGDEGSDDEPIYDIEQILGARGAGDDLEFLIKWKGYPSSHNSWEPRSYIFDAKKVAEFFRSRGLADEPAGGSRSSGSESEEYSVEEILDVRGSGPTLEYLVRWSGYSSSENSWQPPGYLDAPQAIAEFHAKSKKKRRRRRRRRAKPRPEESEEETFEIEDILAVRGKGSSLEYLVSWAGYTSSENSWEPPENVTPEEIARFKQRRGKQTRRRRKPR
jgi:serine/threonine protein kinase